MSKKTPEALIRDPVCEHYTQEGGVLHIRNVFRQGMKTGFPDDTFYGESGDAMHIEFKAPGKLPTRKQENMIATLRDLGHMVAVVDNVEIGKAYIDVLIERHFADAVELEKYVCRRVGTKYRALVESCRKLEAW